MHHASRCSIGRRLVSDFQRTDGLRFLDQGIMSAKWDWDRPAIVNPLVGMAVGLVHFRPS